MERDVAQVVEDRESTSKGLDNPIDPAQRMHLQFGLCSVPTSGPSTTGPPKAVVYAVLSVGKCI